LKVVGATAERAQMRYEHEAMWANRPKKTARGRLHVHMWVLYPRL
jgi:hypothetical protein